MVELRSAAGGTEPNTVRGYAAVFNKLSNDLGGPSYGFHELIQPGAFDYVLKDDVRALFNHDPNFILARSRDGAGTLKIGTDDTGLWYEFEPAQTNAGRDLLVSIKRGDVDQSSFAFTVGMDGEKWTEETKDGKPFALRTITKVARLYDVSPVTYPAYPDASVAVRSLEKFREELAAKSARNAVQTFPMRSQWAARLGYQ
jgi:HK97 family phage prohead protease